MDARRETGQFDQIVSQLREGAGTHLLCPPCQHAVRALNEVKAIKELRGAVLQDLGVLRQHEADYQATQQRIALWSDKSGWAQ